MNRNQRSTERTAEPSAPSGGRPSQGWSTIRPVTDLESVLEMRVVELTLLRETASRLRMSSQSLGKMADIIEHALDHVG